MIVPSLARSRTSRLTSSSLWRQRFRMSSATSGSTWNSREGPADVFLGRVAEHGQIGPVGPGDPPVGADPVQGQGRVPHEVLEVVLAATELLLLAPQLPDRRRAGPSPAPCGGRSRRPAPGRAGAAARSRPGQPPSRPAATRPSAARGCGWRRCGGGRPAGCRGAAHRRRRTAGRGRCALCSSFHISSSRRARLAVALPPEQIDHLAVGPHPAGERRARAHRRAPRPISARKRSHRASSRP